MAEAYTLSFQDAKRARLYVQRLAHYLRHVAIFIDGPDVIVIDGLGVQREPILRLARESGAIRAVPLSATRPDETKVPP